MTMKDYPKSGWNYITQIDTRQEMRFQNKVVRCDYCNKETRYLHLIEHRKIGVIGVGSVCSDKLTGTTTASDNDREALRMEARLESLLDLSKWKHTDTLFETQYEGYVIRIAKREEGYCVTIKFEVDTGTDFPHWEWSEIESKKRQVSFSDAVEYAFRNITSGAMLKYLKNRKNINK